MIDKNTLIDMLDDETSRSYRAFLKYEPMLKIMLDAGAFNVKNGQVIMNFNDLGKLMEVNIQVKAYNHGKFNEFRP